MPKPSVSSSRISFFTGAIGTYTCNCHLYILTNDSVSFGQTGQKIKSLSFNFENSEILYGNAGYLSGIAHILFFYEKYKNLGLLGSSFNNFNVFRFFKETVMSQVYCLYDKGINAKSR